MDLLLEYQSQLIDGTWMTSNHRLDPEEPPVETPDVILAVVERRAPSGAFQVPTRIRLQHRAVSASAWR